MAFAQTRRSELLAGEPMYVWPRDHAAGTPDTTRQLIGITLDGRSIRPLRKPDLQGIVTHLRAEADDTGFIAVFAVTDSSSVGRNDEIVLSYWFGRTDGRSWSSLHQLPMPSGRLDGHRASRLVRLQDEWLFAIPYATRAGTRMVAVYSRSASGWRMDTIPTRDAAYVALTAIRGKPLLYVVYPDSIGSDINSLWLHARFGVSWQLRGRVIRGGLRPVHFPTIASHGSTRVLSWIRADSASGIRSAFAARISESGKLGPVHLIGRNVGYWNVIAGRASRPGWAIEVRKPDRSSALTFVEWAGERPVVRDIVTNPFTGPLLGASFDNDAAAVGPVFNPSRKEEPLVSGILRFEKRCRTTIHEAP